MVSASFFFLSTNLCLWTSVSFELLRSLSTALQLTGACLCLPIAPPPGRAVSWHQRGNDCLGNNQTRRAMVNLDPALGWWRLKIFMRQKCFLSFSNPVVHVRVASALHQQAAAGLRLLLKRRTLTNRQGRPWSNWSDFLLSNTLFPCITLPLHYIGNCNRQFWSLGLCSKPSWMYGVRLNTVAKCFENGDHSIGWPEGAYTIVYVHLVPFLKANNALNTNMFISSPTSSAQ